MKTKNAMTAPVDAVVHTRLPWRAVRSVTCGHLRAEHNYQRDPRLEWSEADIALINAAPELLDALRRVVAISDRKHDAWDAAKAAIAKASGLVVDSA